MSTKGGFFDLDTPQQLFQKLQHDYERILGAPGDRYAAMDFVLTATHLPNWTGNYQKHSFRAQEICRELSNGSKHFRLRYSNIKDTKVVEQAFQFPGFDPAAFQVGHLVVELSGDSVAELSDEISVEALAKKVLDFWQKELRITN
jgi:hypothetical protein